MSWIVTGKNGEVMIKCRIQPSASKTSISGLYNDALKITVADVPVDGKANKALRRFMAKTLGVPTSKIKLVKGEKSRTKTLLCSGITAEQIRKIISLPDEKPMP